MDEARKSALTHAQNLQTEKKKRQKIGILIGKGMSPDEAKAQVMGHIDSDIGSADEQAKNAENALFNYLMSVPNVPQTDVPVGEDENANVEILNGVRRRRPTFTAKDHGFGCAFGLSFGLRYFVAGSRFVAMSSNMAMTASSLAQFMLDNHSEEHGYVETYALYGESPFCRGNYPI